MKQNTTYAAQKKVSKRSMRIPAYVSRRLHQYLRELSEKYHTTIEYQLDRTVELGLKARKVALDESQM